MSWSRNRGRRGARVTARAARPKRGSQCGPVAPRGARRFSRPRRQHSCSFCDPGRCPHRTGGPVPDCRTRARSPYLQLNSPRQQIRDPRGDGPARHKGAQPRPRSVSWRRVDLRGRISGNGATGPPSGQRRPFATSAILRSRSDCAHQSNQTGRFCAPDIVGWPRFQTPRPGPHPGHRDRQWRASDCWARFSGTLVRIVRPW